MFFSIFINIFVNGEKIINMRKGNFERFIEKAKEVHDNKYDYSVTKEPISVKDEIEVVCPLHGVFKTTFDSHVHSKAGCPKCSSKYVNLDSLIMSFKEANPDKKYSYEFVEYNGSKEKVKVFCHEKNEDGTEHGIFEIRPDHLRNGHGCPKCCNRYLTTDDWIEMAKKVHGNKYDYSKVNYKKNSEKVCIICPEHGEFWQVPYSHIGGCGCPKCNGGVLFGKDDFIKNAREIHGDKYDYSKFIYVNANTEGRIVCPIHGEFLQTPYLHVNRKHGCPKCKSSRLELILRKKLQDAGLKFEEQVLFGLGKQTIDFFIPSHSLYVECQGEQHYVDTNFGSKTNSKGFSKLSDRQEIDKEKYDYCTENGFKLIYFTLPNDFHTKGVDVFSGFYKDKTVFTNADSLIEFITGIKRKKEDGILSMFIDDVLKIAPGATVSGNRIKFMNKAVFFNLLDGENSKSILERQRSYKRRGIMVFDVFEDEYITRRDIVLNKIRHLFCLDKDIIKINARKCRIDDIDKSSAEEFLEDNHIQGFVASTLYYGCFYEEELVAVMSFKEEEASMWNLTRYATKIGTSCRGCASKIFKRFIIDNNPTEVKSFADKRWTPDSDSNLYTKLGFKYVNASNSRDYRYWKDGVTKERMHKFGFRKKILHNRYNLPLTMTEKEMTEKLGYIRIWDCGLFKYVWRKEE